MQTERDMQPPYCRTCREPMVTSDSRNHLDQWVWRCPNSEHDVPGNRVVLGKPISHEEMVARNREHRRKELEAQLEEEFSTLPQFALVGD
jgi:hypothetical protein